MRWNLSSPRRTTAFRLALSAGLAMVAALVAAAAPRVRLTPKFRGGETLRYRIESRATTTGKTTTPIANPEGGSQSTRTIDLLVRLDVLDVQTAARAGLGPVRIRATYEQSRATSESDALDLEQSSLEDAYRQMEGRSLEFTIAPDGQLTEFKGLEDIVPSRSAAEPAVSWLTGLPSGGGFPRGGVSIGQKWKSERPLPGVPLTGLIWRSQSTYLRNEPCRRSGGAKVSGKPAGNSSDICAVILTRLEIFRRGSARADATPEDYLRNGLRTSGSWTGSGESLDSISLASGLLVSSTQASTQDMDYVIASAATGSTIHHQGRVHTQSQITLVPESP
jgi:hypothetical protein